MENENNVSVPPRLARELVLGELFDLTLYKRFAAVSSGETAEMLKRLIEVEARHLKFWQEFFKMPLNELGAGGKLKISIAVLFARVFGGRWIHLLLEAIEVRGIRKYLFVWGIYRDKPLGEAVRGVLNDEFRHEEEIVSMAAVRKEIHPERIRYVFLGLNDGLVEIIGAISGFFAAFQTVSAVLIAGLTVAIAGSISMAASAFAAISSEREVENIETRKKDFLGEKTDKTEEESPSTSALIVGISYFFGAAVPVLPVFFGAGNLWFSVAAALVVIVFISYFVAFISGMSATHRIKTNIAIIAIAVSVTYLIGIFAKNVFGISI